MIASISTAVSNAGSIRVLHLSPGNLFGGVETVLLSLAKQAPHCPGVEQEFGVCFDGRLDRDLAGLRVTVHRLKPVRARNPFSVLRARRRLAALIGERRVDALICHSAWAQAMLGPAARVGRAALILWVHELITGRHWLQLWAKRVRPDWVIHNSNYSGRFVDFLCPGVARSLLYCPVEANDPGPETNSRVQLRDGLQTSPNDVVIVQISRMEELKGHLLHLRALARLVGIPGWTCWMVGGTQRPTERRYLDKLRSTASEFGLAARVRFLGQRSDIPDILRAADIFCQPNLGPETFGIVFIEALQTGLPVVSTNFGGAMEIVDDSCGRLLPPNDPVVLAECLADLIRSPALRACLGRNGPDRARLLCDPSQQMQAFGAILKLAIQGHERTER